MPHPIRSMQLDDLDAVLAVQAASYPVPMQESRAILRARLQAARATCAVACDGDEVCGYLFAYPSRLGAVTALGAQFAIAAEADTLYLHDLALAPQAHGRGLARALVEHLLGLGCARGLGHAALVSVQDTAGFWHGLGFRPAQPDAASSGAGLASYPVGALYMVRLLSLPSTERPQ